MRFQIGLQAALDFIWNTLGIIVTHPVFWLIILASVMIWSLLKALQYRNGEKQSEKERDPFMDKMIYLVVWLNSIFGAIVLAIFAVTLTEPETLIKYWFTSFTAELLAMAAIKITKNWKKGGVGEDADYRDQPQI